MGYEIGCHNGHDHDNRHCHHQCVVLEVLQGQIRIRSNVILTTEEGMALCGTSFSVSNAPEGVTRV